VLFADGDYIPVEVEGSDRVLAFTRSAGSVTLRVAVLIRGTDLPEATIHFADGPRHAGDVFADRSIWYSLG
jgi:(1->4)-alpha-D-glucan 1-alpha-D-glucosylmutase